ncbi:hypothetical protein NHX12_023419 [Muraenolepis orangiensis]|uniref:Ubiquitin carboxyl-terminal hydrolase n=1 Tax=Muraenolepis orangiensis TaxID=630683 RepID=A0A9Q0ISR5_9TELE|nr:hypothetical protein NHX12_023419 [Muraenolepis orangiensis]
MEKGGQAPPEAVDVEHEDPTHNLTPAKVLTHEVTHSPEELPVTKECPIATDEDISEERRDTGEDIGENISEDISEDIGKDLGNNIHENKGKDLGGYLDVEESSSVVTAGGSQAQCQSSASICLPGLQLSEGNTEALSSALSALVLEGASASTEGLGSGVEVSMPAYYLVKWITWKEKRTPAKLPPQTEVITTEDLMAHLERDVTHFEFTPECLVFDLLDINLYHGWLLDPQLSYNQLVEKIILLKHSEDSSKVTEGLVAEHFLESTATQLSYHGLCELSSQHQEGQLSVFFRNNHFSTMVKHQGHLYLLVTDQGFLGEEGMVWESLHNVEGDGNFCDSDFRLCHPPQRTPQPPLQDQRQIDQDYLVAMSLQQVQGIAPGALSDLELARRLQQEEYQQPQQPQQQQQPPLQQAPQQVSGQQGAGRRRDRESDCVLL